jgi:hypothetical protein
MARATFLRVQYRLPPWPGPPDSERMLWMPAGGGEERSVLKKYKDLVEKENFI